MDEQDRKMLEEVVKLSRDNNVAVRKLVSYHRSTVIWRVIYWSIIIGSTIAAYYSIQPYWASLVSVYSGQDISGVLDTLNANKK
jgi:hypothetical protein